MKRLIDLARRAAALYRVRRGLCPLCNSDAPAIDTCACCNNYRTTFDGRPSEDLKGQWITRWLSLTSALLLSSCVGFKSADGIRVLLIGTDAKHISATSSGLEIDSLNQSKGLGQTVGGVKKLSGDTVKKALFGRGIDAAQSVTNNAITP